MAKYGENKEPGVISIVDSKLEDSSNFGVGTDYSDEVGSLGQGTLGTQTLGSKSD